ncbi:phage tail assembly protein [Bosea sp. MMO-172]|uniref:phage tail assembly protein n=1 Tax=Bosea sp. MMO-172 TaxID=3127885 RepID=UPI003017BE10
MSTDLRESVSVTLRFPVSVDAVTHTTLTMRRPKMKDSLAATKAPGTPFERDIFLFARLCDVAPNVIEELDELDAGELADQLEAFRRK